MTSPRSSEHEHGADDTERPVKRVKLEESHSTAKQEVSGDHASQHVHVLPPSHILLGIKHPVAPEGAALNFMEADVGISEYIGQDVSRIEGIIKQRFTDFLVYEIDLDSNVVRLKSLEKPKSIDVSAPHQTVEGAEKQEIDDSNVSTSNKDTPCEGASSSVDQSHEDDFSEPWPERFTAALTQFLSEDLILQVKQMYLEGPEPPRISDNGWASRSSQTAEIADGDSNQEKPKGQLGGSRGNRGRGGRGGRSGRGGQGRSGDGGREDTRKVLTDPIASKDTRTVLHKTIRDLFGGKLETETEDAGAPASDRGSRIVIKWSRQARRGGGGKRGRGGYTSGCPPRGTYPPYIHFTLQKTNRDTQDALGHLARTLHVNVKDLSVAGTKDKRGVTVQRVSLKRNGKTLEDVWRLLNCQNGRTPEDAVTQRSERGIRIADLNYRKASLELGMLKGNAFVITLRNVKVNSLESLHAVLNVVKTKGFINYYGMQRFGTASVPTHAIGLALLQSDWNKAISLILQKRHGEHPDVSAARDAWLVWGDLDKALELMPRRVIAERCILESYKKQGGDTRNAMGALSTIPRNLRLMYIHSYQSYVWNAIVSDRIRTHGADKPVVGDLVLEKGLAKEMKGMEGELTHDAAADDDKGDTSGQHKKARKPYVPPKIRTLTQEDLDKYSIFDVVMPLPGTDVAYPGGPLGEKYREFLRLDGLDPDNFVRKQKEYTLNGSYRSILHLPKELDWTVLRYTDPDIALAQADEDRLLGFDPPVVVEDGKFMALQIGISLGTAAYATMALREITKTETSSHFQTYLTSTAEDQKFRGVESAVVRDEDGIEEDNVE